VKKFFNGFIFLMIGVMLVIGGCASVEGPKCDQVLVYEQPYDLTYLRALEAMNEFQGWLLEATDKGTGAIRLRNTEYGHMFDRDKAVADVVVKRISKDKTSISLAPDSQMVLKGKELLEHIDTCLKSKPAHRKVDAPVTGDKKAG